jgi:hypothetical protein
LQEIAAGRLPNSVERGHLGGCPHCEWILAALKDNDATKEDKLYRFMQETRKQAYRQANNSSHKSSFRENLLARLRSDAAFRFAALGATAAILLAVALIVPNFRHPGQTPITIDMPLQDEGKYLMVMEKMQTTQSTASNTPRHQADLQMAEINKLLTSIDNNKLTSSERGKLAQRAHDFEISINHIYNGNVSPLPVSDDLRAVNALHSSLAALPAGQLEESKVDVVEIRQPEKLVVIKGPFRREQLQGQSPVYKALERYAVSQKLDVDVRGPSTAAVIRSQAFLPQNPK